MWNRIFSKIVDSSVWLEPTPTRLIWMMLLATMDRDGECLYGCVANVAARARVSVDEANAAITAFLSPDPNTPDAPFEGRRLEKIEGGYRVLNKAKYDLLGSKETSKEKTRKRVAEFRKRSRNAHVTPSDADADANSNTNTDKDKRGEEADVTPPPRVSEREIAKYMTEIRAAYPKPNGRCDWITGEKFAREAVLNGRATWSDLISGTQRYRANIDVTNSYAMNPAKFFGAIDRPWSQDWSLPVVKTRSSTPRRRTADELQAEEDARNAKH